MNLITAVWCNISFCGRRCCKSQDKSERDSKDDEEKRSNSRPEQLNCLQVVSLFCPPPKSTAKEYPLPTSTNPMSLWVLKFNTLYILGYQWSTHHRDAIEAILPAMSQLRIQYQDSGNVDSSQVDASLMVMAATSSKWDVPARKLIMDGI